MQGDHPNFHHTDRFPPDGALGPGPASVYDTALPWPHGPTAHMRPFNTQSRKGSDDDPLGPGQYQANNHTMVRAAEQEGKKNRKVREPFFLLLQLLYFNF